MVRSMG